MRRLLMLVVSAAMLAGLAVAVPSVVAPETAPQAEAATNVAYINHGRVELRCGDGPLGEAATWGRVKGEQLT